MFSPRLLGRGVIYYAPTKISDFKSINEKSLLLFYYFHDVISSYSNKRWDSSNFT